MNKFTEFLAQCHMSVLLGHIDTIGSDVGGIEEACSRRQQLPSPHSVTLSATPAPRAHTYASPAISLTMHCALDVVSASLDWTLFCLVSSLVSACLDLSSLAFPFLEWTLV